MALIKALSQNEQKDLAAREAVRLVRTISSVAKPYMVLGLGSGSTAERFIEQLANEKDIIDCFTCVATSIASEEIAKEKGLTVVSLDEVERIDCAVDGTDRITRDKIIIKGLGGALLREKIIDYRAEKFLIIADESKYLDKIDGKIDDWIPVEIMRFGFKVIMGDIVNLFLTNVSGSVVEGWEEKIKQRMKKDNPKEPFITENGNFIIDIRIGLKNVSDAVNAELMLNTIPGVIENGIFVARAIEKGDMTCIIAYENGRIETF